MKRTECKNCERIFEGNFCPHCGQNSHEHRIDVNYFLHDIPHSVFHVDQGFFYTFKMLFTRPGLMIKEFLEGKRIKYFRPVAYVMVMTALSAILVKIMDWITNMYLKTKGISPKLNHNFFEHYFSVFIFMMIPFAALITWLFFVKQKYNFWEHFLANTYIAAQLNMMWIAMHFATLLVTLFVGKQVGIDFNIFLVLFLILFMYMYGSVFGFLMFHFYNSRLKLVLLLSLMNIVLSIFYSYGFQVTGIVGSEH